MDFSFTAEQDELRREARAFLEANPAPSFEQLAELGWVGVASSDEFTFVDAAVIFEELGRALAPGPFLFNEVAGQGGDEIWSVEVGGLVPCLDQVDRVLTEDMRAVAAEGETLDTVDETRKLGRLAGNGGETVDGDWETVRLRLLAALALEAVGVGQKALELAIAYAGERQQFGKPIGVYQAVSHKLADTYTELELARSLAYWAAWCVGEDDEQAAVACAAAKSQAADAAVAACERSIQVHGGTGFTWEHVLHRYYKRALGISSFAGTSAEHRAAVADAILPVAQSVR
jgi:alkylation response protein AidB-like acyl-CoA dehydrogenase